jgi:hypothetical protein
MLSWEVREDGAAGQRCPWEVVSLLSQEAVGGRCRASRPLKARQRLGLYPASPSWGRVTVNLVPRPTTLSARICPPWARTISWAIAKPSTLCRLGARLVTTVETFEDPRQVLWGYALSRVRHADLDEALRLALGLNWVCRHRTGGESDPSPCWCVSECVVQQIAEHLGQTVSVGGDQKVAIRIGLEGDLCSLSPQGRSLRTVL